MNSLGLAGARSSARISRFCAPGASAVVACPGRLFRVAVPWRVPRLSGGRSLFWWVSPAIQSRRRQDRREGPRSPRSRWRRPVRPAAPARARCRTATAAARPVTAAGQPGVWVNGEMSIIQAGHCSGGPNTAITPTSATALQARAVDSQGSRPNSRTATAASDSGRGQPGCRGAEQLRHLCAHGPGEEAVAQASRQARPWRAAGRPAHRDGDVAERPPDPPGCRGQHGLGQVAGLLGAQPQHRRGRERGGGQACQQHQRRQVGVDDRGLVADPQEVASQHGAGAEDRAERLGGRAAGGEGEHERG